MTQETKTETHPLEGLAYARFIPMLAKTLPRFMAYSNEVGESLKFVTSKPVYFCSYGLSIGYIITDTAFKVGHHFDPEKQQFNKTATTQLLDTSIWHGTASMLLPSLTIHKGVSLTKKLCEHMKVGFRTSKLAPVAVGIGMIPLIVTPIDEGVSWVMNKYIRPYYFKENYDALILH